MKKLKEFFAEFKKFVTRGNVVDLAVGVIVGGAFTAIVTSLTNNIIRPLINWIIALIGGKEGLSSVYTVLVPAYDTTTGVLDLKNSIYIDWGLFLTAILDFFIIAFVVFLLVKGINASREAFDGMADKIAEQNKKEYKAERKAVKAQAKAEGKKFSVAWKEHLAEKQRLAEEEKAAAEAEAKAKAEADRLANPTQEELLKQIRDLLIENKELKQNKD